MSKIINEGVKRGIRVRLKIILDNEERQLSHWNDAIRHQLNATRQKQVEREFTKRIQALRIVLHMLTPFFERTTDVPSIIVKKKAKL